MPWEGCQGNFHLFQCKNNSPLERFCSYSLIIFRRAVRFGAARVGSECAPYQQHTANAHWRLIVNTPGNPVTHDTCNDAETAVKQAQRAAVRNTASICSCAAPARQRPPRWNMLFRSGSVTSRARHYVYETSPIIRLPLERLRKNEWSDKCRSRSFVSLCTNGMKKGAAGALHAPLVLSAWRHIGLAG